MKKAFALILSLCMVAALTVAIAVTASAETDVTVGQQLSYNQAAKEDVRAWRTSNLSPDGMWKYMFYVPNRNAYQDMKICPSSGNYSWDGSTATGTGPLDYILVRQNGLNFHPGKNGDVCKVFIVPVSGHITLETSIARQTEFVPEKSSGTPTGYAVWLEDTQIYPTDGSAYEAFTSTTPRTVTVETDVLKGQYLYIRISSIDNNNGADGVNMENFITYSSIDDSDPGFTGTRTTLVGNHTWSAPSVDIPSLHGSDNQTTNVPGQTTPGGSSGGFPWWGFVLIGVGVVGVAAAAFLIVKKKKSAE